MNTPTPRRDFILLGAGAAALGMLCPLLGQTPPAPAATQPPPAPSPDVARLRRQLEAQGDATTRLLIELHAKHGAPIVETIGAFSAAMQQANYAKREIDGPRDLQALKAELWDKLPPSFVWETVEQTPERLRFKVTKCPIVERMKRYNAPEVAYALHCASDSGIAAGINPKIRFTRTQTLMQGHSCCDHCYEMTA